MKKYFLIIFFIVSPSVFATEVDQFTFRHIPIKDSREEINKLINNYLLEAIAQTKGCHEETLYQQIAKYLGNHFQASIIEDIQQNNNIQKIYFKQKDTIYRNGLLIAHFL